MNKLYLEFRAYGTTSLVAVAIVFTSYAVMMLSENDLLRMATFETCRMLEVLSVGVAIVVYLLQPSGTKAINSAYAMVVIYLLLEGIGHIFTATIQVPFLLTQNGQITQVVTSGPIVIWKGQSYKGSVPVEINKERKYSGGYFVDQKSDLKKFSLVVSEIPTPDDYYAFTETNAKHDNADWVQSMVDDFIKKHKTEIQAMISAEGAGSVITKDSTEIRKVMVDYFTSQLSGTGRRFLRVEFSEEGGGSF